MYPINDYFWDYVFPNLSEEDQRYYLRYQKDPDQLELFPPVSRTKKLARSRRTRSDSEAPRITGNQLRKIRISMGYTQSEVADICGRTNAWVCQLEAYGRKLIPERRAVHLSPFLNDAPRRTTRGCKMCGKPLPIRAHGNLSYCNRCAKERHNALMAKRRKKLREKRRKNSEKL